MAASRVAVVGIHEYPSRHTHGTANALHIKAHSAARALEDAGLTWQDIDALYDDGDGILWPGLHMPEYFGLDRLALVDTTTVGGSSFEFQVSHALRALSSGAANVALLTYGAIAKSSASDIGTGARYSELGPPNPISNMEDCWGPTLVSDYAQFTRRYMYEHGTTSEQLAEIAVTARHHAVRNPEAVQAIEDLGLRHGPNEITVDDVLASTMIADPLHQLDCCVISDGGGAVVLATEAVARDCRTQPGLGARGGRGHGPPDQRLRHHASRRPPGRARPPSARPASPRPTSTWPWSTTPSPSPCSAPWRTSASVPRARGAAWSRRAG